LDIYTSLRFDDPEKIDDYLSYENIEAQIKRAIGEDEAMTSESSAKAPSAEDKFIHADQLYEKVKSLMQDAKPLDQGSARLIVELADDAIKEYGSTSQERKVELKLWKEKAELVLPPSTLEELRKRSEGQLLKKSYPKNVLLRKALFGVVALVLLILTLLALRRAFSGQNDISKTAPSPTPILSQSTEPKPEATPTPILIDGSLTYGRIKGAVVDIENKPIAGANISITDQNTKVVFMTETVSDGAFIFDSVQFGSYEVSISHPLFVAVTQEVKLQNEPNLSFTVKLKKKGMIDLSNLPIVSPQGSRDRALKLP
jgi:hypothetical protein